MDPKTLFELINFIDDSIRSKQLSIEETNISKEDMMYRLGECNALRDLNDHIKFLFKQNT